MQVRFEKSELDKLEEDKRFTAGFAQAVVSAYRKRLQMIRAAPDERAFRALRSLRFEKLKGKRQGECSLRLNDQWRLIVRIEAYGAVKTVVVVGIEDYH